jgi:lactoylglutathione lyase
VSRYGGTLEHFAGDGLMVFFNDPIPVPDHELQAARLAIAIGDRIGQQLIPDPTCPPLGGIWLEHRDRGRSRPMRGSDGGRFPSPLREDRLNTGLTRREGGNGVGYPNPWQPRRYGSAGRLGRAASRNDVGGEGSAPRGVANHVCGQGDTACVMRGAERRILRMTSFLHTMVRVTDPEKSRAFYEALGFRFSREMDIVRDGELEATNYFFSIGDQENVLELTYNHDGRTYELGTGYGHIAVGVDDLDATLARLKERGIEPERPPYSVRAGGSRICFVRDPESYRVELIETG